MSVPEDLALALKREPKARKQFEALDGANRYAVLWRVHTAKKPETRAARIVKLVAMLARGEKIHP
nr:YdeI/OmpD-associated family protein [Lysobacter sp. BMK333-48F3]